MLTAGKVRHIGAMLIAATALTAAGHAQTQRAPVRADDAANQPPVTVIGQRMPAAEAPKSATCEALARDPMFAAQLNMAGGDPLMGPRYYLPTRMPRNPDYAAAPATPPGSPLPILSRARFGVTQGVYDSTLAATDASRTGSGESAVELETASAIGDGRASYDAAIANCKQAYVRGTGSSRTAIGNLPSQPRDSIYGAAGGPMEGIARVDARFARGRATIAGNDTTLPMAFALFDQGRYAEAFQWFRKAADKLGPTEGGDEARLFVGKLYLQGLGDRSDPVEGRKWLEKTAALPFNAITETPIFDPKAPDRNTAIGEACVILANLYRTGAHGAPRDPAQARRYYDRAFDVGHVPAAKTLGDLYYYGIDTPRDVKKAVALYEKGAKLNHAAAQVALADILSEGDDGVPNDRGKALAWYQAAARTGNGTALFALARAYDFADGVKADQNRALVLYKAAALQGNAAAKTAMGTYFYEGKLVPKDPAIARKWFAEAAIQADPDGMVNLAAMMARGEGATRDLPHAWAWLKQATALGHTTAPRAIAALETRMSEGERQTAAALLRR